MTATLCGIDLGDGPDTTAYLRRLTQTNTMAAIRLMAPHPDPWTLERIARVVEVGIPDSAYLELQTIDTGTVKVDGITCKVRRFEWLVEFSPIEYPDRTIVARGHGDTEEKAFEALLRALG